MKESQEIICKRKGEKIPYCKPGSKYRPVAQNPFCQKCRYSPYHKQRPSKETLKSLNDWTKPALAWAKVQTPNEHNYIKRLELLIEIGERGAELSLVDNEMRKITYVPVKDRWALHFLRGDIPGAEMCTDFNELVDKVKKAVRDFGEIESAIKRAFGLLFSRLSPIRDDILEYHASPRINDEMNELQIKLKLAIEEYLELYARTMLVDCLRDGEPFINLLLEGESSRKLIREFKYKRMKRNNHAVGKRVNEPTENIIDELKRVGYSKKEACQKTAELLHYNLPHIFTDIDPDRIRQRAAYHKNKKE